MSDILLRGAEILKSKIQKLLNEVSEFNLTQPEGTFPREFKQQCEIKLRINKEMNTTNASQRRDEERKYSKVVDDPQGWSVQKIRQFLKELVLRNEEVTRNQTESFKINAKDETSALTAIKTSRLNNSIKSIKSTKVPELKETMGGKTRRPCVFCNKDHWNNECPDYPSLHLRMEHLTEITACFKCLRTGA
ncbi:unnamed protein product [Wuchereria bancrofti]|uniref:Uncharacterized protein n=1 Tax=Wuchereria bancrofti TaxID=6293 RepID=A0A3P7DZW7_WUCBA|nr:unnamed protein product [Wuchereria bancrofti]